MYNYMYFFCFVSIKYSILTTVKLSNYGYSQEVSSSDKVS